MDQLSRRKMLIMGGGALGALGLGAATPTRAAASTDPHWVWDATADPVAAAILDNGQVQLVNDVLRPWTRNDQPIPAGLPGEVHAFVDQARRLPSWADQAKLDRAATFVEAKGTYLIFLYTLGSGLLSTAIPNEARAVYYSKGGADMKDRAGKTGLLGYDVHDLRAFQPDGHIMVTAVKTRLVHAAVRHLLPQSPHWGGEIPISQNDMLVTWHTLATFVMRTLTEWQVPITPEEAESYLHIWQVTAHLLGILDEYIPATWDEAYAQSDRILGPATGSTQEGIELADILLDIASKGVTPDGSTRPLFNALTRYMLGPEVSDMSAIPPEPVLEPLVHTGWPAFVALREGLIPLPLVPKITWTIDEVLRQYILFYLSEGKRINIEMPDVNRPS
jgi:endo-cleaving rubber dioxygenase